MTPTVSRIQIGLGGSYETIVPGAAHTAFASALAQLSPAGGELLVLPGYDAAMNPVKYQFGASVPVAVPDVTIRFAPGAVLDFQGTGASEMFLVSAPRFRVIGAVVDHQAVQKDGRSCFRIQEPVAAGADSHEASFLGCRFRVQQGVSDVLGFSCIRSDGLDTKLRRGLEVRGCTFELIAGTRSTQAWQGDEPFGVCAIRARNTEGCLLLENRFQGPPGASRAACGPMILLDACERSVIASSVFDNLDLIPAEQGGATPPGGSVIRLLTHSDLAGHHTSITGNLLRSIDCRFALELVDGSSDLVTANHFGELGPHCDAVLRVRGSKGRALTVFGNVFREVSGAGTPPTLGRMIHLEGVQAATVDGNVLMGGAPGRPLIDMENDSCSDVHVGATQVFTSHAS